MLQIISNPCLHQAIEIADKTNRKYMPTTSVVVTHDGFFHAHEVFACAILDPLFVIRTRDEKIISFASKQNKWKVIDVGMTNSGNVRDHHQHKGYMGINSMFFVEDIKLTKNMLKILDSVGKLDCKVDSIDYASSIIARFNPSWDESLDINSQFLKAINVAAMILNNAGMFIQIAEREIERDASKNKAIPTVRRAIANNSLPEGVIVLEKYVPFMETILKHNEKNEKKIYFVIYPDIQDSTKYKLHAVPISSNEKNRNLRDIVSVSNKAGCFFIHKSLFIAGYNSLQCAIDAAMKSIGV